MKLSQMMRMTPQEGAQDDVPEGSRWVRVSATLWGGLIQMAEKLERFGAVGPPAEEAPAEQRPVPVRIHAPDASPTRATIEIGGVEVQRMVRAVTVAMEVGRLTEMHLEMLGGKDGLEAEFMALVKARLIELRVDRGQLEGHAQRLREIAREVRQAGPSIMRPVADRLDREIDHLVSLAGPL